MANRIITPEAIASYPWIFKPQTMENEDGTKDVKYSIVLVFLKGTNIRPLQKTALEAAKEKWGAGVTVGKKRYTFEQAIKQGVLKMPFRTDAEEKGYPEGSVFVSARTKQKPGVVSLYTDPATGKARIISEESGELYPGAIVRASLAVFTYDVKGNKGVSFALNNIQKLRDGERLDSFVAAEDEFEAEEAPPADLADLEGAAVDADEDDDDLADLLK